MMLPIIDPNDFLEREAEVFKPLFILPYLLVIAFVISSTIV